MKTWEYKGEQMTVKELWNHPDCETSLFDLEFCLVRKSYDVPLAMKTKLPKINRPTSTYYIHGMELTRKEILELSQCEVSYWKLNLNISRGHPIEEAIKKNPKPLVKKLKRIKSDEYCKTELKSVLHELGSPYTEAKGSQITLSKQEKVPYCVKLSWDYIAAMKLSRLLEARQHEIGLAKYLNSEDTTVNKNKK